MTECKDKWKNIRNGYVRSLKPSFKGSKKPYYLCEELQFLLPYINPATNIQIDKRRLPSPKEEMPSETEEFEQKEDQIEIEVSPEIVRTSRFGKRKAKSLKKKTGTGDVDKVFATWLQNKRSKVDDTRKMFLFSLLPDVRKLSDEQLAVFRIKVLLLLEEVKTQSGDGLQELIYQMMK